MDAYRNVVEFTELTAIGITPEQLARIEDGRGMRLRVETGSVWITEDRSRRDVCLEAGGSYCIKNNGQTLVAALGGRLALVTLQRAAPAPTLAERFWTFWAGLYAAQARPTSAAL